MSDYLIQRLDAAPNVTLHTETKIVALHGDAALSGAHWRHRDDAIEERAIEHVFLFCGANPNTAWLNVA